MDSMSRPSTPGGGSIKDKLNALNRRLDSQEQAISKQSAIFSSIEEANTRLAKEISSQAESIHQRITREVVDLKEDTSHKFALQIAENKRLQHHISRQKEETQKLYKQIEALQTRLLSVERELGSA